MTHGELDRRAARRLAAIRHAQEARGKVRPSGDVGLWGQPIRMVRAALAIISSVILAGCFATGSPWVGTISDCGQGLDAAACRRIAEAAFAAYPGPALAADSVEVEAWASCDLDDVRMITEAAAGGTTCYGVMAVATSGGQRIAEGIYKGGTIVLVKSVVWLDPEGKMHAVTRAVN